MSDIEQKIDELRTQVRENMTRRDEVYLDLGEFLLGLPPESGESGLLEEQMSTAQEHSSRIPVLEASFEDIQQCENDLKEIKGLEAELKKRKSAARETLDQMRENLGEELFHHLNTMSSPVWESAYEPVTEQINKIRDNESELFQMENQVNRKNLLNNMVYKSRISLLKSRKKTLESSMGKLYRKSFEDALTLGAGKNGEETPDGSLLIPWFRADDEWNAVLKEEEALENRKRLSRDHLKELCEGKGAKKKKDALEREILREKELLKDAFIKWGEGVCGNPPKGLSSMKEVEKAVRSIDRLTEEGVALNLVIEKWEARKDIDRLEHDKEYMVQKITTLEEEIQARRQEVRVLKKDITKVGSEIEKKQAFAADLPEE